MTTQDKDRMNEKTLQIEKQARQRHIEKMKNLWGFLGGIHSVQGVKIPIESVALQPYITKSDDGDYHLLILLTTLRKEQKDNKVILSEIRKPFKCLFFTYPEKVYLREVDIKTGKDEMGSKGLPMDYLAKKDVVESVEKDYENAKKYLPDGLVKLYESIINELTEKSKTKKQSSFEEMYIKLLIASKDIISKTKDPLLKQNWSDIISKLDSMLFSTAVVGEFSRGKSTIINRMLKKDILPVGDTPTTAMLTQITYGNETIIKHHKPDGSVKEISETDWKSGRWNDYTADDSDDQSKFEGYLKINFPHNSLKNEHVQIVDTPGANDIFEKRSQSITKALIACDSALIIVSATMPLSLNERAFIEEQIISKKVPKVALILTKLDLVKAEEREKVIENVKNKLKSWKFDIPVYTSSDILDNEPKLSLKNLSPEELFAIIHNWKKDPDLKLRKKEHYKALLTDLLQKTVLSLLQEKTYIDEKLGLSKEKVSHKIASIKYDETVWESIRIETQSRELETVKAFRLLLKEKKGFIVYELKYRLEGSHNPGEWVRTVLPHDLNSIMKNVFRELRFEIEKQIKEDILAITRSAQKLSQTSFNFKGQCVDDSAYSRANSQEFSEHFQIEENKLLKTTAKYGMPVAIAAGSTVALLGKVLTFTPLALVGAIMVPVGVSVSMITKSISERKNLQQKKNIADNLDTIVDAVLDEVGNEFEKNIHTNYIKLVETLQHNEMLWLQNQKKIISEIEANENINQLKEISDNLTDNINKTTTLIDAIRTI